MPTSPGSAAHTSVSRTAAGVVGLDQEARCTVASAEPRGLRRVRLHAGQVVAHVRHVEVPHLPPRRRRVGEPRLHDGGGVAVRVHGFDGQEARSGSGRTRSPRVHWPLRCPSLRCSSRARSCGHLRALARLPGRRAVRAVGWGRGPVRGGQAELLEGDPGLQAVHGATRDGPDDRRVPATHPCRGRGAVRPCVCSSAFCTQMRPPSVSTWWSRATARRPRESRATRCSTGSRNRGVRGV